MKTQPDCEILTYDDPLQRQKWQDTCNKFANIDVFYLPVYSRLFELHGDGKPHFFVYQAPPDHLVIYPFLKRPLNNVLQDSHINKNLYDITSPYGYNGYLRNNTSINMDDFYNCFHKYCTNNNIVSEFVRFHPLLNNVAYSPAQVKILQERETTVIDLSLDEEQIWSSLQPACRNKIRKALKNNVVIAIDYNFSDLENYYKLYSETMDRLNATDYYFFSKNWFYSLVDLMKENVVLFHAYYGDELINSALFLFNDTYINYYLSGSSVAMRKLAANNLLLYEVALWAKSKGIKYFHLGGGYQPNDSLSYFKASFSPYKTKFCIGGVIHQPADYDYLCTLRLQRKRRKNESIYFPLYRSPENF